jgi:hypothetical protein
MPSESNIISHQWELFLKALSDKLAEPTSILPTVRCLTHTTLAKIVQEIRRTTLPSTFPNTPEILKHLINIGWAFPVKIDVPSATATPSKEFYLLDISAAHGTDVDPLELLQAYRPDGIICYFSALTYHSLTTQLPTHHHIAVLNKAPKVQKSYYQIRNKDNFEEPVISTKKASLGELLFAYQGIPCYLTKRLPARLIGFQTRIIGPRTHLRITTLEQTLLDTFHKPLYCGGTPVVFEAWAEGISRFDEDLLNNYLLKINSPLLLRRLGAMFDLIDYTPSNTLKITLEKGLELDEQNNSLANIPLLPGIAFPSLNAKWQVTTP